MPKAKPPIGIKVEPDLSKIARVKKLTTHVQRQRAIKAVAGHYLYLQGERLKKGIKVDGGTFPAYEEPYRTLKEKAGRLKAGKAGAESFWLRLSGQMLRSQKVGDPEPIDGCVADTILIAFEGTQAPMKFEERTKGRYVVTQADGPAVSSALIAAGNNRKRPFVGNNPEERVELDEVFREALDKG
jgi:hypothetical protein